jgi:hypothetical protein
MPVTSNGAATVSVASAAAAAEAAQLAVRVKTAAVGAPRITESVSVIVQCVRSAVVVDAFAVVSDATRVWLVEPERAMYL